MNSKTQPKKEKNAQKKLSFEEAVDLIPDTPRVEAMEQKGVDLINVLWPRRRAIEYLREAPSESISLIGPTKAIPLTVTFLKKRQGRYFYAFIKAKEQKPASEQATEDEVGA